MSFRCSAPSPGLDRSDGGDDHVLRSGRRASRAAPRPPRPPRRRRPCAAASSRHWRIGRRTATSSASFSVLPRFQIELRERRAATAAASAGAGFHHINDARRGPRPARYSCAREGAAPECADPDLSKSMRTGLGGASAAPPPRPPRPPRPPSFSPLRVARRLLFVALRRQRRRDIVRQHDQVDAARDFVLVAGHVEAADRGAVVGAGGEVEILAVAVEGRMARVADVRRSPAWSCRYRASRRTRRAAGSAAICEKAIHLESPDQAKSRCQIAR